MDPTQIDRWWGKEYPGANIGLATGNSLLVIDLDEKHSISGRDHFAQLEEAFGYLPDTAVQLTPTGGQHTLLATDAEVGNKTNAFVEALTQLTKLPIINDKPVTNIDIRGNGGYILVEPSVHPDTGTPYRWHPHKAPIAQAPDWLIKLLTATPKPEAAHQPRTYDAPALSRYGEAALDGAVRNIINAPPGSQRDTLNREAFAIGTLVAAGHIPVDLATVDLQNAAYRMTSYDSHRPWHMQEIDRIVLSGLRDGQLHPRQLKVA